MNFRNSIFTFVLLFLSLSIAHSSFSDTSKDGMETVLFKKGDLGYNTFRIPAILAAKDGTLLVLSYMKKKLKRHVSMEPQ